MSRLIRAFLTTIIVAADEFMYEARKVAEHRFTPPS